MVGEARDGLTDCDHLTCLGEGGGDHAVGVGLEIGIGELIARQIERALRAVEAALCFIACRLLAVEIDDRGPAVGLELRIAVEVGSRLREIGGGCDFGLVRSVDLASNPRAPQGIAPLSPSDAAPRDRRLARSQRSRSDRSAHFRSLTRTGRRAA